MRRKSQNGGNVDEERNINLVTPINAFNETSQATIELQPTRNGSTIAVLPRVGREIIVKGSPHNEAVKVTVADVALLCEEARRAIVTGTELLEAGLGALSDRERA